MSTPAANLLLRAAGAADLPMLGALLPPWEIELAAFVDEDPDDRLLLAFDLDHSALRPVACLRVRRRIGLKLPRYWFHVGCRVHAAPDLGMYRLERTLLLGNDHTGASELCDAAVDADYLNGPRSESAPARAAATPILRRLIEEALHCLRQVPHTETAEGAATRIIAALPGVREGDGSAPFWQGLGRHFYDAEIASVRARHGSAWLTHVAALLPRHPLVVSILPPATQAAIGRHHPAAEDLRKALSEAGFRPGQHVDLYDGGPVWEV